MSPNAGWHEEHPLAHTADGALPHLFWKTQRFADVPGTIFGRAGTNLGRDGLR